MRSTSVRYLWFILCCLFSFIAHTQTVGLLQNDQNSFSGYTLFAKAGNTYLIDNGGQIVHTWINGSSTMHPGYLMDNGDLLVVSRGVKRLDWDGNLLWSYTNPAAHHDVAILPNGNVLLLIRGSKTNAESLVAGRNPALIADNLEPMVIYEVNPQGSIVWQWHVWDHLIQDFDSNQDNFGVVEDHPELVDINFTRGTSADWLHGNAINYNEELDQIMVSPRFNSEIWIIDHSTTSQQAASHLGGNANMGGDILYRWGNPIAYRAGTLADQQLYGSHDAQWIAQGLPGAGNIIMYNNGGTGFGRDGNYSTIDELTPPLNGFSYDLVAGQAFAPFSPIWSYQATPREDFYSSFISGVQRLPNGNTFIDEGENGNLFEITNSGNVVWKYQNPITNAQISTQGDPVPAAPLPALFRSYRYAHNHPGLVGKNLIPNGTVELYDAHWQLTIQSPHTSLMQYPGQGIFMYGQEQLITLIANEFPPYTFLNWSVESGFAVIEDINSVHTTFSMESIDTIIQANYEIDMNFVFSNSFE